MLLDVDMRVCKRDGSYQPVSFDKILKRVENVANTVMENRNMQSPLRISQSLLTMRVIDQLHDGITTSQIDELTAQECASMTTVHSDYGYLASAILVSNHHKNMPHTFSEKMEMLWAYVDVNGDNIHLVNDVFIQQVRNHAKALDEAIEYGRDYLFDYFGYKTLERAYLMKLQGQVPVGGANDKNRAVIVETPQDMFMRVACAIHLTCDEANQSLERAISMYHNMSRLFYTHASPTLFNAGARCQQLSSCYLVAMEDDSIEGIFNTLKDCAIISKMGGGIGVHMHNIRAKGSIIRGTNGTSNGLVPMLRVFNNTARYVDQGGNKRKGSIAIYLEPWHADVEEFLEMRKNHGDEESKARDLFYALWVPDLFMRRVKSNGMWSLMCPNQSVGLMDVWGEDFDDLYEKYEAEGKYLKQIKARDLWYKIMDSQIETGTPYLLFKDAANRKSNQKNLGTIKSSNLCVEIIEYSDSNETAVCNLASICLSQFVNDDKTFDFDKLAEITMEIVVNLNLVIDINRYPTTKTQTSNMRHRPIGIGVQGLADVFAKMGMPFASPEAQDLNEDIAQVIYFAAMKQSHKLVCDGLYKPYSTFTGSPLSRGIFQFDMWGLDRTDLRPISINGEVCDWKSLSKDIIKYGVANSLLVAPMPTASTSQIMGNNEAFEPFTSNIYVRRTLAGEFVVINKYLQDDLISRGMWNEDMKNRIIANKGSIQNIAELPEDLKEVYKTVWEIPMRSIIDMAAARGKFVCQSQSMNLWMENPTYQKLSAMHFYSWEKGLKSGIYYLRTKAKAAAQQFTIEPTKAKTPIKHEEPEICESCSA